jgi:hypothetical protein
MASQPGRDYPVYTPTPNPEWEKFCRRWEKRWFYNQETPGSLCEMCENKMDAGEYWGFRECMACHRRWEVKKRHNRESYHRMGGGPIPQWYRSKVPYMEGGYEAYSEESETESEREGVMDPQPQSVVHGGRVYPWKYRVGKSSRFIRDIKPWFGEMYKKFEWGVELVPPELWGKLAGQA